MTNSAFCFVCFGPMPKYVFGRPRKWCSGKCKQKAYRIRRKVIGSALGSMAAAYQRRASI